MKSSPKIAIIYPASVPWMGLFVDGIRRFAHQFGGWRLYTSPPGLASTGESSHSVKSLVGWKGDAGIAVVSSEEEAEVAKGLSVPVINISTWVKSTYGLPRVGVDNWMAGRLAADHLIEKGLTNLVYLGWRDVYYSEQRMLGFVDRARERGLTPEVRLDSPVDVGHSNWGERLGVLEQWLSGLSHPCGIFAVHDYRAQLLMEACDGAGLRVPHDVAVMGMDNDVITCEHSMPTLTSVSRNSDLIGWETASLIHRILSGEGGGDEEILVPSDGVVARQSTDMLYLSDQVVQIAASYMISHLRQSFNMEEVARHAGVSKRTLEMRFRSSTGKSPHQFLTEARIAHAQKLISRPDKKTLRSVASECGFSSYPAFFSAYQKVTGTQPSKQT